MHTAILMMLLAVVSSSAMAEWVELATTDISTFYVEPTTIRKSGNKVKMWVLENFNSVQEFSGDKYLSQKAQDEFDCKEMMRRALSMTLFHGNMGTGGFTNISGNKKPRKWYSVEPDSTQEVFWKFACGK